MQSKRAAEPVINLPKGVCELLNSCPKEGSGVHSWLFKTALQLHRYFSEDKIFELLKKNLSCQRPEREICEAIANAGRYARGEMAVRQTLWPTVDYAMVHKIVVNCPVRLKDLSSISPTDLSTEDRRTEEILDAVFQGNPLLCFALLWKDSESLLNKTTRMVEGQRVGLPIHCAKSDDQGSGTKDRRKGIATLP